MRLRSPARNLLRAILLLSVIVSTTRGQEKKEWTWTGGDQKIKTRTDLLKILADHERFVGPEWVLKNGKWEKPGRRADLRGARLENADLNNAQLESAELNDAWLKGAHLNGADLSYSFLCGAFLENAHLNSADLTGAHLDEAYENHTLLPCNHKSSTVLRGAHLNEAYLDHAYITNTNFSNASLAGAHMSGAQGDCVTSIVRRLNCAIFLNANLTRAQLERANLSGANLSGVHLSDAHLDDAVLVATRLGCVPGGSEICADLRGAQLIRTELRDADFEGADLDGTVFEPKSNPETRGISAAKHLEFLTYQGKPDALVQLRKAFQDGGFRDQERRITYALNRRRTELDGPVEGWFKRIAFDWTCQYGMNPWRALRIWLWLLLLCTIVYAILLHLPKKSELYQVRKVDSAERAEFSREQICWRWPPSSPESSYPTRILRSEMDIVFWAAFFSLISGFNIGFRDINLGQWLRLLTNTEYDLKATGWARTVSGFQSLIGVYLIGLWVLTYFGRPFE